MRVKSVEYNKNYDHGWWDRFEISFEHNGVEWVKFVQEPIGPESLLSLLNSVIEDTLVRNTKWDK